MFKKLCLIALCLLMFPFHVPAADDALVYERGNFKIALHSDGTASIVKFFDDFGKGSRASTDIIEIPSALETNRGSFPVTRIGKEAFLVTHNSPFDRVRIGPVEKRTKPERIIIPEGVVELGERAFSGRNTLIDVDLPQSLQVIGISAFSGCSKLKEISLPENLKTIGAAAFRGCEGLTGITLPEGLQSIERRAFMECTALKSIVLPDSVTTIDSEAFADCDKLSSVTIPASVTSIAENAFHNTKRVTFIIDGNFTAAADFADRKQIKVKIRPSPSPSPASGQPALQSPLPSQPDHPAVVLSSGSYRELKTGSQGDDVLAARQRLFDLGYLSKAPTQLDYTSGLASYVKNFEQVNGLSVDGVLSEADQALLFSEKALPRR